SCATLPITSHYTNYTAHNLQLLLLLRERTDASESTQTEILSDQNDVPEWPLTSLEKPCNVFGDTWFVRLAQHFVASEVMYDSPSSSKRPSPLSERWAIINCTCTQRTPPQVRRFYYSIIVCPRISSTHFGGPDRRLALLSILKSMLVTYSSFLGALLAPPPRAASNTPPNSIARWITILNVMASANDLRLVQPRAHDKHQLELRREETRAIHECDLLEAQLAQLRDMAKQNSDQQPPEQTRNGAPPPPTETDPYLLLPIDKVAWAKEL
ncbi:hypothetical protein BJV77DRAFT_988887, partial [Russula vinacea]